LFPVKTVFNFNFNFNTFFFFFFFVSLLFEQNLPKLIFKKGILRKFTEGKKPPYAMSNASRKVFSRRIDSIPRTHDSKALRDPLRGKLKGDEMADFIITAALFAVEGLVSQKMLRIVQLLQELFLIVEDKSKTDVKSLKAKTKELGRLMEEELPVDSRPITTHRVLVHYSEAVQETGILSESNGQWIEDVLGSYVEIIRRRGIKVNVEQVLTRSISRQLALRKLNLEGQYDLELPEELDYRNKKLWDTPDADGNVFLGRGKPTFIRPETRSVIAEVLRLYHQPVNADQIPENVLGFGRAYNGLEFHTTTHSATKASNSSTVHVTYEEGDYFGRIQRFLLIPCNGLQFKFIELQLHLNTSSSPAGIKRVKLNEFYKGGNYVLLETLRRRVQFVQRNADDNFYYVLPVRKDLLS